MAHRVFVIEDQIEEAAVAAAFEADAARWPDPEAHLELVGLAQNHTDAFDQLESLEASSDGLPDAIVLDDYLPDGDSTASRMIQIMRWLLSRARKAETPLESRPRAVLWSSCEPNIVYTFCALGGLQYQLKKDLRGQEIPVAAIWRALAGQRWRPQPFPNERDLTLDMREALPYLKHGWTQKRTALHLGLGERGLSGFVAKVKEMPRAPGPLSPDYPANDAGALRVLAESGWVWVPHRLHDQMPAGMPFPLVIDPAAHLEDLPPRPHIPEAYIHRWSQ